MKRELSNHLRERPMPDPDNQRLLNELGRRDDRGNLLRFLDDPGVESRPTIALSGHCVER